MKCKISSEAVLSFIFSWIFIMFTQHYDDYYYAYDDDNNNNNNRVLCRLSSLDTKLCYTIWHDINDGDVAGYVYVLALIWAACLLTSKSFNVVYIRLFEFTRIYMQICMAVVVYFRCCCFWFLLLPRFVWFQRNNNNNNDNNADDHVEDDGGDENSGNNNEKRNNDNNNDGCVCMTMVKKREFWIVHSCLCKLVFPSFFFPTSRTPRTFAVTRDTPKQ